MEQRTTTDNHFIGCPAKMPDARIFTDYRPSCIVNELMQKQNSSLNSYDYRQYLIRNGTNLMKMNNDYISSKNTCSARPAPLPDFKTVCKYDKRCGECGLYNKCGLGQKNESR